MKPIINNKVFVLGDSRTGTTSLHKYLQSIGFNSIHYFFKESGITQPVHLDHLKNWEKLKLFINNDDYNAFSDYPTRSFYKELMEEFPDDYFVLTVRSSIEKWKESMVNFFTKFDIEINIEELASHYLNINQEIRDIAKSTGRKYLEICIDDGDEFNSKKLNEFFDVKHQYSIGRENTTDSYNNQHWDSRVSVFKTDSSNYLLYIKSILANQKAMLSEYGWIYLINDSSDYMDFLYGGRSLEGHHLKKIEQIFSSREKYFSNNKKHYFKFFIPEKPVVYPEYLPKIFGDKSQNSQRPVKQIDNLNLAYVKYMDKYLASCKQYGQLYFRGDTHLNWLGAYFAYYHIISVFNSSNIQLKKMRPIFFSELVPTLAAYGGDLFVQLSKEYKDYFSGAWREISLGEKLEHVIKYSINPHLVNSCLIDEIPPYVSKLGERQTLIYQSKNRNLPSAVVFRDSTCDFMTDLIAEHFSRVVFIWYKGEVIDDIVKYENPDVVLHIMAERFTCNYYQQAPVSKLLP
jgi:hypothetical protein